METIKDTKTEEMEEEKNEKEEIKELLDDIDKGLFIFLEKAMYHPEIFDLDDHLKQKKSIDAIKKLKEIFK